MPTTPARYSPRGLFGWVCWRSVREPRPRRSAVATPSNNGYAAAARAVAGHGYRPVVRPVGGHLALYDADSLVLHLAAPHPDPRESFTRRFELLAATRWPKPSGAWGVDARVGAVPGEYCDGAFSINAGGRRKLVGTGQRLVRGAYLFSAVVMVRAKPELRTGLREAYDHLGRGSIRARWAPCRRTGLVSMPRLRSEILVAGRAVDHDRATRHAASITIFLAAFFPE